MNIIDLKNYLSLVNPDTEKYYFLLKNNSLGIFNRTASVAYIISILITKDRERIFLIFIQRIIN